MEFGGAPIVSLPVDELEFSRAAIEQWHAGIVRFPALVEATFGERVAARVGPAFVGYTDPKHLRLVSPTTTCQLTAQDEKAVNTLREACAVEEWEHGGSEFRPRRVSKAEANSLDRKVWTRRQRLINRCFREENGHYERTGS